jgi:hypothetical protein
MGGITKTLFGGSDSSNSSQNQSGYGALPSELQQYFKNVASQGQGVVDNASEYFAPMGINADEMQARSLIDPSQISSNIENYLNPFSSYAVDGINDAFSGQFGALKSQADEAGAFGSSKYRGGMEGLEEARLGAIGSLLGSQYNTGFNQMLNNASNLMNFGGLQRSIDFSQRQALPSALNFQSGLINPLLGSSQGTTQGKTSQRRGLTQGIGDLFGGGVPIPGMGG